MFFIWYQFKKRKRLLLSLEDWSQSYVNTFGNAHSFLALRKDDANYNTNIWKRILCLPSSRWCLFQKTPKISPFSSNCSWVYFSALLIGSEEVGISHLLSTGTVIGVYLSYLVSTHNNLTGKVFTIFFFYSRKLKLKEVRCLSSYKWVVKEMEWVFKAWSVLPKDGAPTSASLMKWEWSHLCWLVHTKAWCTQPLGIYKHGVCLKLRIPAKCWKLATLLSPFL